MSDMDALLKAYSRFVALPWKSNLAPPQRVWLVIYPPSDERRLRARVAAFGVATSQAEKGWKLVDITDGFAQWLGNHPYRDYAGLVIMPSMNLREHVCAGQRTAAA